MGLGSNRRIRRQDARELYLLVSACRAIGGDGLAWRQLLINRLPFFLDADMAFFADHVVVGKPGAPSGWLRPISIVDHWPSEAHRDFFWEQFVRDGRHENTPMAAMIDGHEGYRVAARRDVISDDNAYRNSHFYRRYLEPSGLDDFVHSVNKTPDGHIQMLTVQRKAGRPPFPRRTVHWIRALWVELRKLQPQELRPADDSAFMLPKRMLQVLACILSGFSVRQTAEALEISTHTVQEHIKRLYKRTGAKNRAELTSCYRDVAPILHATTVSRYPDYRQQIKQATQPPWPRADVRPPAPLPCNPIRDPVILAPPPNVSLSNPSVEIS